MYRSKGNNKMLRDNLAWVKNKKMAAKGPSSRPATEEDVSFLINNSLRDSASILLSLVKIFDIQIRGFDSIPYIYYSQCLNLLGSMNYLALWYSKTLAYICIEIISQHSSKMVLPEQHPSFPNWFFLAHEKYHQTSYTNLGSHFECAVAIAHRKPYSYLYYMEWHNRTFASFRDAV